MTFQSFNLLNQAQQQKLLLKRGSFLDERTLGPYHIMLYQLSSFYVEVYFITSSGKSAFFRSFQATDGLQPYLDKIDLQGLYKELQF
ncbi:hypothetical protein OCK74_20190 [Chitinophagaceae bacterium LB-8]|uniref:Uncharacterized protein n=1 Tax=Paraflavisolibacter caeni TaxID=2982496 RepID=A0A9X3BII8_9BACT|nr:hypothetical protein [Paraflavisolibacter caeni]MCU7551452.1 hypothetical protein [Paraflavisolibacter caeni]